MELFTTSQVARLVGVSRQGVLQRAKQHGIGQMVGSQRLYSREDLERLRTWKKDRRRKHATTAADPAEPDSSGPEKALYLRPDRA